MTLADNMKIMLGLIEEYSPTNVNLTDDEDIYNRLKLVYSPNYQNISQEKKIIRTKEIVIKEDINSALEENLPEDMYQFKRIVALDSNNNRFSPEYDIIGKKIYLKQKEGKYIIEYYAYPTTINQDTKNNFELEIDADAQSLLPYLVANDILKVDPSADYSAFYAEFQRRLERFDTRTILPSAEVIEIEGNDW